MEKHIRLFHRLVNVSEKGN